MAKEKKIAYFNSEGGFEAVCLSKGHDYLDPKATEMVKSTGLSESDLLTLGLEVERAEELYIFRRAKCSRILGFSFKGKYAHANESMFSDPDYKKILEGKYKWAIDQIEKIKALASKHINHPVFVSYVNVGTVGLAKLFLECSIPPRND